MKAGKSLVIASVVIAALAFFANYGRCAITQDVNVSIEIPGLYNLYWDTSGNVIDLTGGNAITVSEFIAGFRDQIPGGTLAATANGDYDLTVKASDDLFAGGSGSKPTSDMAVELDFAGYTSLNGINDVTLLSNQPAEFYGLKYVDYKISFLPADTPGVYTTTLTYTIKPHI
jgi:hypothetical protein